MNRLVVPLILLALEMVSEIRAEELPDIREIAPDLQTPTTVDSPPAAGLRVKQVASDYRDSDVYHTLYLPTDWLPGERYPLLVEYAGNGQYENDYGDVCTGRVEDCKLGYGLSGGEGFIWLCLPYISADGRHNQLRWWGDVEATVDYCKTVVRDTCNSYGGDPAAIFLAGFSRGSIACNYLGLYDDEIASLWCGFICHSHYDGVKQWGYTGGDRASAAVRLKRLRGRPQFISHEGSVDQTREYLATAYPEGDFTFLALPYRNHTESWVLRDIPERSVLQEWVKGVLGQK